MSGFSASRGQLPGSATNDSAVAGNVGEQVSATVATGSAVALTHDVVTNITSISLGAGDWDVWINGAFNAGSGTQVNDAYVSINTSNSALDQTAGRFGQTANFISNGLTFTLDAGPFRFSLSTTTTIYFNVYAGFITSTLAAWGTIQARRVR